MRKGFINLLVLGIAGLIALCAVAYVNVKVQELNTVSQTQNQKFGSVVTQTQLTDTLGTFRTNVNNSLTSLQADLNNTTSTDPGHKHTTSSITGVFGYSSGGSGNSATPTNGQLNIGNGSGYTLANLTGGSGITVTNGAGTITLTGQSGQNSVYVATAGEALSANDAVFLGSSALANYQQYTTAEGTGSGAIGATATTSAGLVQFPCSSCAQQSKGSSISQSFSVTSTLYASVTSTIKGAVVSLAKNGAPVGNVIIELANMSNANKNIPDTTASGVFASTTILGSSIGFATSTFTVQFPVSVNVTSSVYFLVATTTAGSADDTNVFLMDTTDKNFTNGTCMQDRVGFQACGVGGAFIAGTTPNMFFKILNASSTDGLVYKTNANSSYFSSDFLGFAANTYASGTAATINTVGVQTGFSNLQVSFPYYLTNSPGAISSSTPSAALFSKKVGIAIGTSTLTILQQ